jgi:hypothetical protein
MEQREMTPEHDLSFEQSFDTHAPPGIIAAVLPTGDSACALALNLRDSAALSLAQIRVIGPREHELERQIEPGTPGTWFCILHSRLLRAVAGLSLGGILGLALNDTAFDAIAASRGLAVSAILMIALFLAFLAASLLGVQPRRERLLRELRNGARHGNWAVVAHPATEQQAHRALRVFERTHLDLILAP